MAKHRAHSIEFKRHIAQDFIAGETLRGHFWTYRPFEASSIRCPHDMLIANRDQHP